MVFPKHHHSALQWEHYFIKNVYNSLPHHHIGIKINECPEGKQYISQTLCDFLLGWQALQSLCMSLVGAKCAPTASSFDRSSPLTASLDLSWSFPLAYFQRKPARQDKGLSYLNDPALRCIVYIWETLLENNVQSNPLMLLEFDITAQPNVTFKVKWWNRIWRVQPWQM